MKYTKEDYEVALFMLIRNNQTLPRFILNGLNIENDDIINKVVVMTMDKFMEKENWQWEKCKNLYKKARKEVENEERSIAGSNGADGIN